MSELQVLDRSMLTFSFLERKQRAGPRIFFVEYFDSPYLMTSFMKKDAALVVLLVGISTAGFAQPSLITFDDMPTAQGHIPNGYFGLNWTLEYLDAAHYPLNPSGYLGRSRFQQLCCVWVSFYNACGHQQL